jgi:hypothetical protein
MALVAEGLLGWFDASVDYAAVRRELWKHYGDAANDADLELAAVDRAMEALADRTSAIQEGRVALVMFAPEVAGPGAPPPAPPAEARSRKRGDTQVSAPGRVTPPPHRPPTAQGMPAPPQPLQPVSEAPPPAPEAARHDTLMMDADAIQALIAADKEAAATAAQLRDPDGRVRADTERQAPKVDWDDAEFTTDSSGGVPQTDELDAAHVESLIWRGNLDHVDAEEIEEAELAEELDAADAEPLPDEPHDEPEGMLDLQDVMWTREVELLYDDVLYLFHNGDMEGALISLERLLVLAPPSEAIQEFIALNETKLVDLYENLIGPWTRVPRRNEAARTMPPAYTQDPKISKVLSTIDGETAFSAVISAVPMSRLEVCSILNQLMRAQLITTEPSVEVH